MASGVSFGSGEGQPPSHSLDAALRELSLELDKLVSELEAEMRQTKQVSSSTAQRLHQLRFKFQRVLQRRS